MLLLNMLFSFASKDTLVTHNVKEATNEGNSLSHIMTESTEMEKNYFAGVDDAELAKQEEGNSRNRRNVLACCQE